MVEDKVLASLRAALEQHEGRLLHQAIDHDAVESNLCEASRVVQPEREKRQEKRFSFDRQNPSYLHSGFDLP